MDTEFKPSALLVTVSIVILSVIASIAFVQHGKPIGVFLLLLALWYVAGFIFRYRKYIIKDDRIQQLGFDGKIITEVYYSNIANMYLHKGQRRTGSIMRIDQDVETLVIQLNNGPDERFDMTSIDNSDELDALLRSKIGA